MTKKGKRRIQIMRLDIPGEKVFESSADREPSTTDLHCLQHPRIPQLVQDDLRVKYIWILQVKQKKKL